MEIITNDFTEKYHLKPKGHPDEKGKSALGKSHIHCIWVKARLKRKEKIRNRPGTSRGTEY